MSSQTIRLQLSQRIRRLRIEIHCENRFHKVRPTVCTTRLTSNRFPFLKQGQSVLGTQELPSQAKSGGQNSGQLFL